MSAILRRLLLLFPIIAFNAFPGLGGETSIQPSPAEQVIERLSIKKDSCWIMLPVEIKGKRYHLGLDTGTDCTIYDKSLWHLMGKTVALEKIGTKQDNITIPYFQPPDARLGKLALPKSSLVMGTDLRDYQEDSGEDIHGFLGMDFLNTHIFRVDFDQGEVVFLRALGSNPGQRLAVGLTDGVPNGRVRLAGRKEPEWFVLDTGAARGGGWRGGCLRKATFDTLVKSGGLASIGDNPMGSLTGRRMHRSGWLDSLFFAGNTHKNLAFFEWDTSLLGLDVLSRYVVTFDFPHQAIYLKKGRQFDRPIRYDRSGLYARRVKGQTGVASVQNGSAAAKAGILPGDVLLQIDKEQINGMTLFTLRDRLCESGKKVVLTVRRGAQQVDVIVVLSSDK